MVAPDDVHPHPPTPPVDAARRDGGAGETEHESFAEKVGEAVHDAAALVEDGIERLKPHLRGWLHLGTAPLALAAGVALVVAAPTTTARVAALVFAVTSVDLFATSALFHRGRWSRRTHDLLRRLDHANIFLVIAGSYTPFALLLLEGRSRTTLLTVVWATAVAGVLFRTLWLNAPRWLYTPVYVLMGWVAVFYIGEMHTRGGGLVIALLALGGVLYTAGGVVYATRRPNPSPRWFGFHEVFHALTVLAFAAHCTAVAITVLRA